MARPTRFELVTSAFGGQRSITGNASGHSEIFANLLNGLRSNFLDFSERALIVNANQLDFDSAIPRFESWRAESPRTSCVKPLFARAVRPPVVHSEILILDAFVTRVMQCACGFRVAATRSIGCCRNGDGGARLSESPPAFLRPILSICTIMRTRSLPGVSSGCLCPAET